jgi:hypothetical protein
VAAGEQTRDRVAHDVLVTDDPSGDLTRDAFETFPEEIDVLGDGGRGHRGRMK